VRKSLHITFRSWILKFVFSHSKGWITCNFIVYRIFSVKVPTMQNIPKQSKCKYATWNLLQSTEICVSFWASDTTDCVILQYDKFPVLVFVTLAVLPWTNFPNAYFNNICSRRIELSEYGIPNTKTIIFASINYVSYHKWNLQIRNTKHSRIYFVVHYYCKSFE
jgi:hypothetical protein